MLDAIQFEAQANLVPIGRFPDGADQWISAAGTSWALMALSLTVEPRHGASEGETQIASGKNDR